MATQSPPEHCWYTPDDCADLLQAVKHGTGWRARCPVHGGDNPQSLHIWASTDQYAHPMTSIYCHAQHCARADLCAALGIEERQLYSFDPRANGRSLGLPAGRSPRIAKLKGLPNPTPDDIVQAILEEEIVADPEWIETCAPARKKLWELAQQTPEIKGAFTRALVAAHLVPSVFWKTLAREYEG